MWPLLFSWCKRQIITVHPESTMIIAPCTCKTTPTMTTPISTNSHYSSTPGRIMSLYMHNESNGAETFTNLKVYNQQWFLSLFLHCCLLLLTMQRPWPTKMFGTSCCTWKHHYQRWKSCYHMSPAHKRRIMGPSTSTSTRYHPLVKHHQDQIFHLLIYIWLVKDGTR